MAPRPLHFATGRIASAATAGRGALVACVALLALVAGASLLAGCAGQRPMSVPLRTVSDLAPRAGGAPADTLAILLPGAYDAPEDFLREGFVAAVRERRLPVDLQLVDAHLGYYGDRSVIDRLRQDIVLPARQAGYRRIWLVGISLGGFGALAYAMDHGNEVDGLFLLAPYLGTRGVQKEIAASGGLLRWHPGVAGGDDDDERRLWHWLAQRANGSAAGRPPIWQGYGRDDRFAPGHRLLATALPTDNSQELPGGHDWTAWRALWDAFLERGIIASTAAGTPSAPPCGTP